MNETTLSQARAAGSRDYGKIFATNAFSPAKCVKLQPLAVIARPTQRRTEAPKAILSQRCDRIVTPKILTVRRRLPQAAVTEIRPGMHILTNFDDALDALRADASAIGKLTEKSLQNSMKCLLQRNRKACVATIADDDEIDLLDDKIEADGVDILVRFQPAAPTLRQIIATMRFGNNVERVADQATKVARRGRKLSNSLVLADVASLQLLFLEAISVFSESIRAFANTDVDLARSIQARDRRLDEMSRLIASDLTRQINAKPDLVGEYLSLIFVARHLERIGGYAKNIADDVVYVGTGDA